MKALLAVRQSSEQGFYVFEPRTFNRRRAHLTLLSVVQLDGDVLSGRKFKHNLIPFF